MTPETRQSRTESVTITLQGDATAFVEAMAVSGVLIEGDEWSTARATRRDQVYDLLRDAGDQGITLAELARHVPLPGPHVESLICEGHGIRCDAGQAAGGRWEKRWVLEKDAWA